MVANYSVRISLPFSDLSGAVRKWATRCDSLVVYEHPADASVKRTHCHMLLMYVSVTTDQLKNDFKETVPAVYRGSGNGFWSFKTKTKDGGDVTAESAPGYVTYMTKGVYDPKFVKEYTQEFLDERKALWVDTKTSKNVRLCAQFKVIADNRIDGMRAEPSLLNLLAPDKIADVVAACARSWAFSISNGQVWDIQTARVAKMVFLTYCMREGITLTESFRWW